MKPASDQLFDPADVTWQRVSTRLIPVRRLSMAIGIGLPILVAIGMGIVWRQWWIFLIAAALAGLFVWLWFLIPRQVKAIGYAERSDDLWIRRGIMFRELSVVPYGRMQFVDVNVGPLERAFRVASVQLHTASAMTDAAIPGLDPDEAARLRDRLASRGEARLAGL